MVHSSGGRWLLLRGLQAFIGSAWLLLLLGVGVGAFTLSMLWRAGLTYGELMELLRALGVA